MANNSFNAVLFTEATFGIADYVVFAFFLSLSGSIGVYFSCRSKKTTDEYFLGDRQMGAVPLGLSTGVSCMSALALVGMPAEVFINGFDFIVSDILGTAAFVLYSIVIARILYPLGMTSINQYLERRFHSPVLSYAANLMVLACIFHYMGTCMLGSVIAFTSMTGGQVSISLGLTIAGVVGIFYTSIGGLKAVVWTDVIQTGIMVLGVVAVIIKTLIDTDGGLSRIIAENVKHGRFHHFNWSLDPTVRHTGWSIMIGGSIDYAFWAAQPASVQRICVTKNLKDAIIAAVVAGLVMIFFSCLPGIMGLNIFGYYASRGCDIYAAKWIKNNEIVSYYVRERLSFPGFQGLFLASLFSASLSSLSSGLNTLSMLLWKETVKPLLPFEVTERSSTIISEIFVIILGFLAMLWCYCLHSFGGLIQQVTMTTSAAMFGPYGILFLMAILFFKYNAKAGIISMACSFCLTMWLGLGSVMRGKSKVLDVFTSTTDNCAMNSTTAISIADSSTYKEMNEFGSVLDSFYSISYTWISTFCLLVMMISGLLATACTTSPPIDPKLLFPWCRPRPHVEGNDDLHEGPRIAEANSLL